MSASWWLAHGDKPYVRWWILLLFLFRPFAKKHTSDFPHPDLTVLKAPNLQSPKLAESTLSLQWDP
jgi:hypothetical protein